MQKFGLSGIKGHVPTTVVAAALGLVDAVLSWLNVIALPVWAHSIVALLVLLFSTYKGQIAAAVTTAVLLLLAPPALAQDSVGTFAGVPPAPKISYSLGGGYALQGGLGLGGSAFAKVNGSWQIVKNVQIAGLLEVVTPWTWADPIVGPAWQTGEAQGWGGTFGFVEKKTGASLSAAASPIVVGGKVSWAFVGGTVLRY